MTKYDELCEMAVSNYGLVTAKTIDALGIHLKDVLEWVKSGRIEKRGRGVYRIAHYLPTEYDTYAEAAALVGDTAMICGESVLAMHNLALVNPARVHVAVRRRLRKELPDWIETEKVPPDMTEDNFNGIPCQKLAEVIRQSRGKILTERLVSAVREAGTRGLLDVFEYDALKKEFSNETTACMCQSDQGHWSVVRRTGSRAFLTGDGQRHRRADVLPTAAEAVAGVNELVRRIDVSV